MIKSVDVGETEFVVTYVEDNADLTAVETKTFRQDGFCTGFADGDFSPRMQQNAMSARNLGSLSSVHDTISKLHAFTGAKTDVSPGLPEQVSN